MGTSYFDPPEGGEKQGSEQGSGSYFRKKQGSPPKADGSYFIIIRLFIRQFKNTPRNFGGMN
jgi:hypothetical protein